MEYYSLTGEEPECFKTRPRSLVVFKKLKLNRRLKLTVTKLKSCYDHLVCIPLLTNNLNILLSYK